MIYCAFFILSDWLDNKWPTNHIMRHFSPLLTLAEFKWMVYAYVTFKTNIRADLFSSVAVQ